MAKIYSTQFHKGSLIDSVSGVAGTLTAGSGGFKKTEKGLAMEFDGANTNINYGNIPSFSSIGTGNFTFAVIAKLTKKGDTLSRIIGKKAIAGAAAGTSCYWNNSTNKLLFSTGDNSTVGELYTSNEIPLGYHLILMSRDSNDSKNGYFYVDNIKYELTSTLPLLDISNTDNLFIGGLSTNLSFGSYISSCKIFNHVLTQTERNELYKEFLQASPIEKPVRGFEYPKPTDLSSEVDSVVGEFNNINFVVSLGSPVIDGNTVTLAPTEAARDISYWTIGKKYLVDVTVTNYSGTGSGLILPYGNTVSPGKATANGNYVYEIIPDISNMQIYAYTGCSGTITVNSIRELTGLVAAYNMIPSKGGVLTDISGNGNNGVINGALSTKDGMKFDGVDDVVNITSLNLGKEQSILFKAKSSSFNKVLISGSNVNNVIYINSSSSIRFNSGGAGIVTFTGSTFLTNESYDIVITRSGTSVNCYVNGLKYGDTATLASDNNFEIDRIGGYTGAYFEGEIEDLRIYNYAFTPQQAKDYHNSFNKPVLRDALSDAGADGVVKTPREWIKGTGDYKVEETVIEQGELVTNGAFDTDSDWTKEAGWTISGGIANANTASTQQIYQNIGLVTGKKYKLCFDILNYTTGPIYPYLQGNGFLTGRNSNGSYCEEFTYFGTNGTLYFRGSPQYTGSIDNISVVEIPPLSTITTGTKYLENTTAGTTAIQSKQAYGEWEFDVYKGADGNSPNIQFISGDKGVVNSTSLGYRVLMLTGGTCNLQINNGGTFNYLFRTNSSYIANNTWYRLKVARLQSEGVFKDIPTLQVSDCENSTGANPYSTFISNGRYGFKVIQSSALAGYGGTNDEISIVSGGKYIVEFNLKLNSGTLPVARFMNTSASSLYSDTVDVIEGKNSVIITATSTLSTASLMFRNLSTTTDYEISGLTIRRIYDADTFAVFIKGGDFGDTYTLVDTTGGSGSNPVTDSTYTTSEYIVADLDAGDRLTNILLNSGVDQ
jgi:hypothetical protein